eukprot:TRINITY_DN2803_c0_g1_i1.p1 TRINITY_DN2803_c0_g1~~TRINITY_DN2803_c0_g1_i1.p1  ORF type:complete len:194 (-),score=30.26 TRINITY_DN2803_c0_g1_i1:241-822(-)
MDIRTSKVPPDLSRLSLNEARLLLRRQQTLLQSGIAESLPDKGTKLKRQIAGLEEIVRKKELESSGSLAEDLGALTIRNDDQDHEKRVQFSSEPDVVHEIEGNDSLTVSAEISEEDYAKMVQRQKEYLVAKERREASAQSAAPTAAASNKPQTSDFAKSLTRPLSRGVKVLSMDDSLKLFETEAKTGSLPDNY